MGFFLDMKPARFDGCPESGNLVSGRFFAAGDFFSKGGHLLKFAMVTPVLPWFLTWCCRCEFFRILIERRGQIDIFLEKVRSSDT